MPENNDQLEKLVSDAIRRGLTPAQALAIAQRNKALLEKPLSEDTLRQQQLASGKPIDLLQSVTTNKEPYKAIINKAVALDLPLDQAIEKAIRATEQLEKLQQPTSTGTP